MKISDNESLRASQIASVTGPRPAASKTAAQVYGQGTAPAAQVDISEQAQAVSVASAAVAAAPDVREDLVSRLKAQVDAGTYKVGGKDIADQILRRAQADRLQ